MVSHYSDRLLAIDGLTAALPNKNLHDRCPLKNAIEMILSESSSVIELRCNTRRAKLLSRER
jgi:hypothetical protein